ncbi:19026_t:CDS:1, partial [Dentiscutata erythropus]
LEQLIVNGVVENDVPYESTLGNPRPLNGRSWVELINLKEVLALVPR